MIKDINPYEYSFTWRQESELPDTEIINLKKQEIVLGKGFFEAVWINCSIELQLFEEICVDSIMFRTEINL